MLPYLLLMFAATFFSAISQVLLKQSAGRTYKSVIYEYLNWRVIVAYGISFSVLLLNTYAYTVVPMKYGAVIDTFTYVFVIQRVKMDGKVVEEEVVSGVLLFIGSYIVISLIAIFIVALDGFDLVTTTTSVIATISNIGPGFEMVGATGNFAAFSPLSKIVLSFCMLAGRLEIYPMLILFSPSIWRKKY